MQILEVIKKVGLKRFPSTRSQYAFSQKRVAELLNVTTVTVEKWLEGITSPNERQIKNIKTLLQSHRIIDENWEFLDEKVGVDILDLQKENERLKEENIEYGEKVNQTLEEAISIRDKVISEFKSKRELEKRITYLEKCLIKHGIEFKRE